MREEPSLRNPLSRRAFVAGCLGVACSALSEPSGGSQVPLCVSGIYPHLAVFSHEGECGIGAVAPWAGKLWYLTYPPHMPQGSADRLYALGPDMRVEGRPESVGGTHAGRLIHRETEQLIIGPYFIDKRGNVRAADIHRLVGRMTAVARHLTDPADKVYFYDMEGALYEVDVRSLAVTKLFSRVAPGVHGKGGYTGQGRLVVSNNGEVAGDVWPKGAANGDPEAAGALAEWDGRTWSVIARRQFTEVTGPGGLLGAPTDDAPLWATGWDRRSVLLLLRDGGAWHTFRLPKASHTYDPRHGWYTEWPRIREVGGGALLMTMHGMFFDFPRGFRLGATDGIAPVASYLRIIPDFCEWGGRLVLASDDTTIMQNPMAGQSISNLWFGKPDDLRGFGPAAGWGGPWLGDPVHAGAPSDPFAIGGYARRVLHLAHDAGKDVRVAVEVDGGDGAWTEHASVRVPASGYAYHVLPARLGASWLRVRADVDCNATAYLHCARPRKSDRHRDDLFGGLADVGNLGSPAGIVRPAGHNRNLQVLLRSGEGAPRYVEVDEHLQFAAPADDRSDEVARIAAIRKDFEVDAASVIMLQDGRRYRLPKGDPAFDRPFEGGWPRGIRECITERYLANIHGTFYEIPRESGLPLIKPVASHRKRILDFCTWRGLLVVSGARHGAAPDGHLFVGEGTGIWFGSIDDLWRLGAPVGVGGPWRDTYVRAGEPSDPYLMTGYNRKRVELSHDAGEPVVFTIEVDFDHQAWRPYLTVSVPPGRPITHRFPPAYSAHWVRVRASRECAATAWFTYAS